MSVLLTLHRALQGYYVASILRRWQGRREKLTVCNTFTMDVSTAPGLVYVLLLPLIKDLECLLCCLDTGQCHCSER